MQGAIAGRARAAVDLNLFRAKVCDTLEQSLHTSAHRCIVEIEKSPAKSNAASSPIAGVRGMGVLSMSQAEYQQLLDCTGRAIYVDKRGVINGPQPNVLA